jgi:hypothetical protein
MNGQFLPSLQLLRIFQMVASPCPLAFVPGGGSWKKAGKCRKLQKIVIPARSPRLSAASVLDVGPASVFHRSLPQKFIGLC